MESRTIEQTGRTVEEAIEAALKSLGLSREEVEIEVLAQEGRGLLGILGTTVARVRVTPKPTVGDRAVELLNQILSAAGLEAEARITGEDQETVYIEIFGGSDLGILIGRRGQTLAAAQHLVGLIANKGRALHKKVILDAQGYRERRERALGALAADAAEKVKRTGEEVILEPLPPWERRVVHLALAEDPLVRTSSVGEEPQRRVVVSPREEP